MSAGTSDCGNARLHNPEKPERRAGDGKNRFASLGPFDRLHDARPPGKRSHTQEAFERFGFAATNEFRRKGEHYPDVVVGETIRPVGFEAEAPVERRAGERRGTAVGVFGRFPAALREGNRLVADAIGALLIRTVKQTATILLHSTHFRITTSNGLLLVF